MNPATVFIVDDDDAVRDSLSLLCETAGLRVESYASAEAFLAASRPDLPGCLVLDVRMGQMSGPELHEELNRRGYTLPIIYLTGHGDIPMSVRAMKAGAVDFLTKPVDGAALVERLQAALKQSCAQLDREQARVGQRQRLAQLSAREQEVLQLMLTGLPNKVIAKQLGISHRTVEAHRANIFQKTGTGNLIELAQLAADCGLPPPAGED